LKQLVIDPNVLLSALRGPAHSPPALLLAAARTSEVEAVACPELIAEVARGLEKPYFNERIDAEEARESVSRIERIATMLDDPAAAEAVLRDPKDNYLVALAREAGAEAIVSGDKDLLDHWGLEPPALSAREACELAGLI
jgi:putative PIN family toxin of toxin-antitoxin system